MYGHRIGGCDSIFAASTRQVEVPGSNGAEGRGYMALTSIVYRHPVEPRQQHVAAGLDAMLGG